MIADPYVFELVRPEGYSGHVSERQYANDFYGDFFNYTRTKNPEVREKRPPRDGTATKAVSHACIRGWILPTLMPESVG